MNLVIVESPAKGRTIEKILGRDYKVMASFGHVRDLPKKEIGIDLKNDFDPVYEVPAKARKVVSTLKKASREAENLYLATDYDREGEAIAWHIVQAIGLNKLKSQNSKLKVNRITFHEITKPAILAAIKQPHDINLNLVDAQQGRRVLDRLVGYKLSPFLLRKVASGLSAGRVQSVAVRLIVEKEREIRNFKPEEFWVITANLAKKRQDKTFKAFLETYDDKKITRLGIKNQKEAQKVLDDLQNSDYRVSKIEKEEKKRYPSAPFTTSTLQQTASSRLGFSPKRTMKLAQGLYEDGLITYMRTDSVQVSVLALNQAKKVITEKFGQNYALESPRFYKTKSKGAQEAHEAIRPTNLSIGSVNVEKDAERLYDLIWKRMMASQMKEAVIDETKVKIAAKNYGFLATGAKVKFEGFLKVYSIDEGDEQKHADQSIPTLIIDEKLDLKSLFKEQKFTQPPSRYNEASLIKELEKRGIGRPSTYAPTVSTIMDRGYVEKSEGKLIPKEIGEIVTDLLVEHFPEIIDYNFTAKMEEELDQIAEGKTKWQKVLHEFYDPFAKNLAAKTKEVSKKEITEEKTDKICPKCSKEMVIKLGRFGKFYACSGFPDCKHTEPLTDLTQDSKQSEELARKMAQEKCPKCNSDLAIKEGRYGKFLACSGYPKCKFTKNIAIESKVNCPNCGEKLVQKRTRKGKMFWGCAGYPKCKTAFWDEPQEEKCPQCKNLLTKNNKTGLIKCSQCEYKKE